MQSLVFHNAPLKEFFLLVVGNVLSSNDTVHVLVSLLDSKELLMLV